MSNLWNESIGRASNPIGIQWATDARGIQPQFNGPEGDRGMIGKRRVIRWCGIAMALAIAVFSFDSIARAQEAGISVIGTARVSAKPNVAEIWATVSGDAELTADAIVKYNDSRKRAVAALEALSIPSLKIESDGVSVRESIDASAQQQAMIRGLVTTAGKQKTSVSERLRLTVSDVDKLESTAVMELMLKIMESAKDSGLIIGDNSLRNYNSGNSQENILIRFKVSNSAPLRQRAYQAAIDDAKTKAQKLAEIAGLKINRILNIRDSGAASVNGNGNVVYVNGSQSAPDPNELVSATFSDVPMIVSLNVQFEIQK